jgi:hypothetical protein
MEEAQLGEIFEVLSLNQLFFLSLKLAEENSYQKTSH